MRVLRVGLQRVLRVGLLRVAGRRRRELACTGWRQIAHCRLLARRLLLRWGSPVLAVLRGLRVSWLEGAAHANSLGRSPIQPPHVAPVLGEALAIT
ncbi:hypothetical protein GCM10020360_27310 [Nonlabens tegetincola]